MEYLGFAFFLGVVGFALIFLEVIIPSLGLLSLLAALSVVGSIICAFLVGPWWGLGFVLSYLILIPVVVKKLLDFLPKSSMGKKLILTTPHEPSEEEKDEATFSPRHLEGKKGEAVTNLRPSGMAKIEGRKIDVITEGRMVDKGAPVKVIKVEGNRVVVRAIEQSG